ncbi:hypothetical protein F0562_033023 [Nyssa sinensis]|uniref:Cytochrome P450 CYP749A22-like n=1 Tax=Nyssa sinensis TaxID=561372 RepID=A0A5J5AQI9_9ASTE|nr:hypothetical protein F0562_033023 [Nyssa sinensis]
MKSQGIKGPSYRFIYGNIQEVMNMRMESMSRPMGLSHQIFLRIQPHMYSWVKIYGKNFLGWYGSNAQLIITESELVKEILNNRDKAYPKADLGGYMTKLLGDGLVTSEGEKWAKLRKLANHAFRAESLKNMIPAMIASVEMMLEKWKQREAFGSSYLEGKDIFDMLRKFSIVSARNGFKIRLPGLSKFLKSRDDIKSDKLEKGIRDSIIKIIKKREKAMKGEADNFGTDFLGLLLKANHDADKNNRITVEDMVDECKTFYVAGHESTSTLLTWTVLLLAIHTDWQEKARQEVFELFGKQHPNSENIGRLQTVRMIINETLRLYPPVVTFARKVKREVKLGKFTLPANINLNVPTLALHHDPQIWGEDVHLFKPERFSEGVAKATNNNPAVYLPFGFGPRSCAGTNFAINEAKIALSMILQRYTFTLSPAYSHSPVQVLTVRPQHGVQVILEAL